MKRIDVDVCVARGSSVLRNALVARVRVREMQSGRTARKTCRPRDALKTMRLLCGRVLEKSAQCEIGMCVRDLEWSTESIAAVQVIYDEFNS